MTISDLTIHMIRFCKGSLHDIEHFLKVWAYAKTIGEAEGLDADTQEVLEVAAIVHDIACPMCREKYGSTAPKYQEPEGARMSRDFLAGKGYSQAFIDRVVHIVGHHHTIDAIDGPDFQILVEADYLVNAGNKSYPKDTIRGARDRFFKTPSGIELLTSIYGL